jgi:ribosomal protein S18 acetylase RimI-like enzyme
MEIRKLTSDDAEVYWNLRLEALQQDPEAFATTYEDAISRVDPLKSVASKIAADDSATFGAFIDNELVGVMTITQEGAPKLRHRVNLFAVYVTPNVRGKRVGTALLQEVVKYTKQMPHVEKINLTVVSTNKAAIKLYEKVGFKSFGLEHHAMKMNDTYVDEVYMSLSW